MRDDVGRSQAKLNLLMTIGITSIGAELQAVPPDRFLPAVEAAARFIAQLPGYVGNAVTRIIPGVADAFGAALLTWWG